MVKREASRFAPLVLTTTRIIDAVHKPAKTTMNTTTTAPAARPAVPCSTAVADGMLRLLCFCCCCCCCGCWGCCSCCAWGGCCSAVVAPLAAAAAAAAAVTAVVSFVACDSTAAVAAVAAATTTTTAAITAIISFSALVGDTHLLDPFLKHIADSWAPLSPGHLPNGLSLRQFAWP